MVTSFNERQEYTAVEPAESYGTDYLEAIEEELTHVDADLIEPDRYSALHLRFNRAEQPPGSDRDLTMRLGSLELADGQSLAGYDTGVRLEEPYIVEGAYQPVSQPDTAMGTWRWCGGPTRRTSIYVGPEVGNPQSTTVRGVPIVADIEAGIYFNGDRSDHGTFDKRGGPERYSFSLDA